MERLLLLLEGQTVHLPRPKNQFSTDLCIDRNSTIPFFATSKSDIEYVGKFNLSDERESDMMDDILFQQASRNSPTHRTLFKMFHKIDYGRCVPRC